jgi:feruloyl esterase
LRKHEIMLWRPLGRSPWRGSIVLSCLLLPLIVGFSPRVRAADYLNLSVVKPLMSCPDLQKADLGAMEGVQVTIQSTAVTETPKGPFCRVIGVIGQITGFEVLLPQEHWTQRLLQIAAASGVGYAGGCAPAVNGEFVVVFTQNAPARPNATRDTELQAQIDSAYRATHLATLAAKALIRTLYGQPQRFAYFVGCSAGGGQAMVAVERHPEDFDGVSAGSPLLISGVHNVFYHPWESTINKRADGSRILASDRLPILHKAVMEHCAASAGALDGVLLQPTACRFQRAWVQCKAGAADTSACLTAEEAGVVENLYAGPGDGNGHRFEIGGFAMGSELRWGLSTADRIANREANTGERIKRLLQQPESDLPAEELQKRFAYNQEWFDKISALAPLYGSANTNIRPFQRRGGKLIMWNGGADLTIQPEVAVAYYQGVQKVLGVRDTDQFMRLFMIPGFGHCEGGDIPFQFDVLTPLMAWTELDRAPERILAGKPANVSGNAVPFGGVRNPVAAADVSNAFARPIFPFPLMARYAGKGDPNDAASYKSVKSAAPVPQKFNTAAAAMFAPDNQRTYHVANGRLVPDSP